MAKFTLHDQYGNFMHETARTLEVAKAKCLVRQYKCTVCETYFAPSPWDKTKIVEHGKEVFRNYNPE